MATVHSRQGRVSLKEFELQGVQDTGRKIGDGSYATVIELDFHGLKCVGKKLHGLLYNTANPLEKANLLMRFAEECELLSRLHHPCIVQFLGVCFEQGSQLPVLVMEYLHTTLSACIDKYGILPPEILYGILQDVILGLRYLHEQSPSIIHRDLSANNVLLATNMSAKISDLGVAKILNLSPAQMGVMTQTQTPGTPCYMPPEAMIARPKYTNKVDIFSYGVMMVHMLSGQWPIPGEVFRPDPNNPDMIVPVPEVDRRIEYLQKIDQSNPLLGLIRQCLSNNPQSRPEAVDILSQVEAVISQLPPSLENRVELIQLIQGRGEDRVVTSLRAEIKAKAREIEEQKRELESKKSEVESKIRDIEALSREVEVKNRIIDSTQREVDSKVKENASQEAEIQSIKEKITQQRRENELLRRQLESQSLPYPKPATVETKLQWRRCADLPKEVDAALAVLVRGKVYIGGVSTTTRDNDHLVFEYDPERDAEGWTTLPPAPVEDFALATFQGNVITVGGRTYQFKTTRKIYRYIEKSQEWKEFLKPMPTERFSVSVVTTQSAIIVCGGVRESMDNSAAVEVYLNETEKWHKSDSLPIATYQALPITIGDTCYLLRGRSASGDTDKPTKTMLSASISSLIEKATSSSRFRRSVWKTVRDTPLKFSAATTLSGSMVAVGGSDDDDQKCSSVHMFQPQHNSWVKMTSGDLPVAVTGAAAIELSNNRLLVCGGNIPEKFRTMQVFMATVVHS